jgi:NAD(P)-dependent dehydrogenase (short-subunit alcohol dehydrogenase family)
VRTDVSKAGDIEVLAQKTLDAFGGVHLLFNNAGVYSGLMNSWESTLADWQWVMGVNLWGVIYGLRSFVPIMLAQDSEGHIVNNASLAGLTSYHPSPPYQVTKHAVVALSENLYFSLAATKAKVKASLLCTGWVKTRIMDADRNRPTELQNIPGVGLMKPAALEMIKNGIQAVEAAMPPQEVAGLVFQAIRNEQFYILTHPEANSEIQTRMENILNQRNPA